MNFISKALVGRVKLCRGGGGGLGGSLHSHTVTRLLLDEDFFKVVARIYKL